jgi:F420-dependent oxidoreductase-like protein
MSDMIVAVHVPITSVPETVATVQRAERAGVRAVWFTSGGFGPDSLTTIAVIGAATERILIGTAVVVTYSRHPLVMAQQSLAIDDVAPGRFRLGIGPGHRPTIEEVYGLPFDRPLEQLREYSEVLTQALGGDISYEGRRLRVQGRLARAHSVPVYFSALRVAAYCLAGELASGAISWVTPAAYLRDVAGPTLRDAAREHGRPAPRLVGHVIGLVTDDPGAAIEHGRQRLAANTRQTFYQRLFADAGHPDARDGTVPDSLLEEVVAVGDEQQVARRLQLFLEAGCDEVIVTILPGTPEELGRTFRLVGRWNEGIS